ncbi:MAG: ribosome maturation factor RimM [Alphaproteobacteria bacterium]|jgi:16S rRNA processing protein RimM
MVGKHIMVGEFGRPHGVRGLLRLRAFTADPAAITAYGPLSDEAGTRHFHLTLKGPDLVAVEGVADRDAAQRLTGTKLFVAREALPPTDDEEFYLADLIGLRAVTEAGDLLGVVRSVEDHGGGAFLVVEGRQEFLLPFTRQVVPTVDIAAGQLLVVPPAEIVVPPEPGKEAAA